MISWFENKRKRLLLKIISTIVIVVFTITDISYAAPINRTFLRKPLTSKFLSEEFLESYNALAKRAQENGNDIEEIDDTQEILFVYIANCLKELLKENRQPTSRLLLSKLPTNFRKKLQENLTIQSIENSPDFLISLGQYSAVVTQKGRVSLIKDGQDIPNTGKEIAIIEPEVSTEVTDDKKSKLKVVRDEIKERDEHIPQYELRTEAQEIENAIEETKHIKEGKGLYEGWGEKGVYFYSIAPYFTGGLVIVLGILTLFVKTGVFIWKFFSARKKKDTIISRLPFWKTLKETVPVKSEWVRDIYRDIDEWVGGTAFGGWFTGAILLGVAYYYHWGGLTYGETPTGLKWILGLSEAIGAPLFAIAMPFLIGRGIDLIRMFWRLLWYPFTYMQLSRVNDSKPDDLSDRLIKNTAKVFSRMPTKTLEDLFRNWMDAGQEAKITRLFESRKWKKKELALQVYADLAAYIQAKESVANKFTRSRDEREQVLDKIENFKNTLDSRKLNAASLLKDVIPQVMKDSQNLQEFTSWMDLLVELHNDFWKSSQQVLTVYRDLREFKQAQEAALNKFAQTSAEKQEISEAIDNLKTILNNEGLNAPNLLTTMLPKVTEDTTNLREFLYWIQTLDSLDKSIWQSGKQRILKVYTDLREYRQATQLAANKFSQTTPEKRRFLESVDRLRDKVTKKGTDAIAILKDIIPAVTQDSENAAEFVDWFDKLTELEDPVWKSGSQRVLAGYSDLKTYRQTKEEAIDKYAVDQREKEEIISAISNVESKISWQKIESVNLLRTAISEVMNIAPDKREFLFWMEIISSLDKEIVEPFARSIKLVLEFRWSKEGKGRDWRNLAKALNHYRAEFKEVLAISHNLLVELTNSSRSIEDRVERARKYIVEQQLVKLGIPPHLVDIRDAVKTEEWIRACREQAIRSDLKRPGIQKAMSKMGRDGLYSYFESENPIFYRNFRKETPGLKPGFNKPGEKFRILYDVDVTGKQDRALANVMPITSEMKVLKDIIIELRNKWPNLYRNFAKAKKELIGERGIEEFITEENIAAVSSRLLRMMLSWQDIPLQDRIGFVSKLLEIVTVTSDDEIAQIKEEIVSTSDEFYRLELISKYWQKILEASEKIEWFISKPKVNQPIVSGLKEKIIDVNNHMGVGGEGILQFFLSGKTPSDFLRGNVSGDCSASPSTDIPNAGMHFDDTLNTVVDPAFFLFKVVENGKWIGNLYSLVVKDDENRTGLFVDVLQISHRPLSDKGSGSDAHRRNLSKNLIHQLKDWLAREGFEFLTISTTPSTMSDAIKTAILQVIQEEGAKQEGLNLRKAGSSEYANEFGFSGEYIQFFGSDAIGSSRTVNGYKVMLEPKVVDKTEKNLRLQREIVELQKLLTGLEAESVRLQALSEEKSIELQQLQQTYDKALTSDRTTVVSVLKPTIDKKKAELGKIKQEQREIKIKMNPHIERLGQLETELGIVAPEKGKKASLEFVRPSLRRTLSIAVTFMGLLSLSFAKPAYAQGPFQDLGIIFIESLLIVLGGLVGIFVLYKIVDFLIKVFKGDYDYYEGGDRGFYRGHSYSTQGVFSPRPLIGEYRLPAEIKALLEEILLKLTPGIRQRLPANVDIRLPWGSMSREQATKAMKLLFSTFRDYSSIHEFFADKEFYQQFKRETNQLGLSNDFDQPGYRFPFTVEEEEMKTDRNKRIEAFINKFISSLTKKCEPILSRYRREAELLHKIRREGENLDNLNFFGRLNWWALVDDYFLLLKSLAFLRFKEPLLNIQRTLNETTYIEALNLIEEFLRVRLGTEIISLETDPKVKGELDRLLKKELTKVRGYLDGFVSSQEEGALRETEDVRFELDLFGRDPDDIAIGEASHDCTAISGKTGMFFYNTIPQFLFDPGLLIFKVLQEGEWVGNVYTIVAERKGRPVLIIDAMQLPTTERSWPISVEKIGDKVIEEITRYADYVDFQEVLMSSFISNFSTLKDYFDRKYPTEAIEIKKVGGFAHLKSLGLWNDRLEKNEYIETFSPQWNYFWRRKVDPNVSQQTLLLRKIWQKRGPPIQPSSKPAKIVKESPSEKASVEVKDTTDNFFKAIFHFIQRRLKPIIITAMLFFVLTFPSITKAASFRTEPGPSGQPQVVAVVERGDTMWDIAGVAYKGAEGIGEGKYASHLQWPKIYENEFNRKEVLKDRKHEVGPQYPDTKQVVNIQPGDELIIPGPVNLEAMGLERPSPPVVEVRPTPPEEIKVAPGEERITETQQELQRLQQQKTQIEQELVQIQEQREATQSDLEKLQRQKTELTQEILELRRQLTNNQEELRQAKERLPQTLKTEDEMRHALEQEIKQLEQKKTQYAQEITELERQHQQAQEDLRQIVTQKERAAQELEQLRSQFPQAQEEIKGLQDEIQSLEDQKDQYQEDLTQLQNQKDDLQKGIDQLNQDKEELQKDIEDLRQEISNAKEILEEAKERIQPKWKNVWDGLSWPEKTGIILLVLTGIGAVAGGVVLLRRWKRFKQIETKIDKLKEEAEDLEAKLVPLRTEKEELAKVKAEADRAKLEAQEEAKKVTEQQAQLEAERKRLEQEAESLKLKAEEEAKIAQQKREEEEKKLAAAKAERAEIEAETKALKAAKRQKEKEAKVLRISREKRRTLQTEVARLREQERDLKKELRKVKKGLKEEIKEAEEEAESTLTGEQQRLKEKLDDERDKVANQINELEERLQKAREEHDRKFSKLGKDVDARRRELSDLQDQLNKSRDELKNLQDTIAKLERQKTELQDAITKLKREEKELRPKVVSLRKEKEKLEEKVEELKEIEEAREEVSVVAREIAKIETDIANLPLEADPLGNLIKQGASLFSARLWSIMKTHTGFGLGNIVKQVMDVLSSRLSSGTSSFNVLVHKLREAGFSSVTGWIERQIQDGKSPYHTFYKTFRDDTESLVDTQTRRFDTPGIEIPFASIGDKPYRLVLSDRDINFIIRGLASGDCTSPTAGYTFYSTIPVHILHPGFLNLEIIRGENEWIGNVYAIVWKEKNRNILMIDAIQLPVPGDYGIHSNRPDGEYWIQNTKDGIEIAQDIIEALKQYAQQFNFDALGISNFISNHYYLKNFFRQELPGKNEKMKLSDIKEIADFKNSTIFKELKTTYYVETLGVEAKDTWWMLWRKEDNKTSAITKKIIQAEHPRTLWEIDVEENGRLAVRKIISPGFGGMLLQEPLRALSKTMGILKNYHSSNDVSRIKKIKVVEGNDRLATADRENGEIIIDIDAFSSQYLLLMEVEHELLHFILPTSYRKRAPPAIEELLILLNEVSRFLSLRSSEQEDILNILKGDNDIDDQEFYRILQKAKEIGSSEDYTVIEDVIEYIKKTYPPEIKDDLANKTEREVRMELLYYSLFDYLESYEDAMAIEDLIHEWDLLALKQKLSQARQNYRSGLLSKEDILRVELEIVEEIFYKIGRNILFEKGIFELSAVVELKKANCLGFTYLASILFAYLGFSFTPIEILELPNRTSSGTEATVAYFVGLSNGYNIAIDNVLQTFSKPFMISEQYYKDGIYLGLINDSNPNDLSRRIRLLNKEKLYANILDYRGYIFMQTGEYQKAISEYSKAIELDPDSFIHYHNRGVVYSKIRKYQMAINDFNRTIQIYPDLPATYVMRANTYILMGNKANAIDDYTKVLGIIGKTTTGEVIIDMRHTTSIMRLQASLGKEKYKIGLNKSIDTFREEDYSTETINWEEINKLRESMRPYLNSLVYLANPEDVSYSLWKIIVPWRLDILQRVLMEARQKLIENKLSKQELQKLELDVIEDIVHRIKNSIKYGDVTELDKIIENSMANTVGMIQLFYILSNIFGFSVRPIEIRTSADTSQPKGQIPLACLVNLSNDQTVMVNLDKEFISHPFMLQDIFYKDHDDYWQLRQKDNPLNLHRKFRILTMTELIANIYVDRGVKYFESREFEKAISTYKEAIKLDPKDFKAFHNLGNVYLELGQLEEAIDNYSHAIKLAPQSTIGIAYLMRGYTFALMDRIDDAKSDFLTLLILNPDHLSQLQEILDYLGKRGIVVKLDIGTAKGKGKDLFTPEEHVEVNQVIGQAQRDNKGLLIYGNIKGWRDGRDRYSRDVEEVISTLKAYPEVDIPELGRINIPDILKASNVVLIQPRNKSPGLVVKDMNTYQVAHSGAARNSLYIDQIIYQLLLPIENTALIGHETIELAAKKLAIEKNVPWTLELAKRIHRIAEDFEVQIVGKSLTGDGSRLDDKISNILKWYRTPISVPLDDESKLILWSRVDKEDLDRGYYSADSTNPESPKFEYTTPRHILDPAFLNFKVMRGTDWIGNAYVVSAIKKEQDKEPVPILIIDAIQIPWKKAQGLALSKKFSVKTEEEAMDITEKVIEGIKTYANRYRFKEVWLSGLVSNFTQLKEAYRKKYPFFSIGSMPIAIEKFGDLIHLYIEGREEKEYIVSLSHIDSRYALPSITPIDEGWLDKFAVVWSEAEGEAKSELPKRKGLSIESKENKEYLKLDELEFERGKGGISVPRIDLPLTLTNRFHLKEVLKDVILGENTLLVGETGTGKSSLVLYLARLLNRECKVMSLNEDTDVKDLLVRQTFGEKEGGKTGWMDSVLVEAMRNDTYIILDEIDRVQPGVLSSLNNILQFRQVTLPNGEVVRAHPDFRVFATMNPPRPPYIGNLLSGELEDRFSIHTIVYLPKDEELSVLQYYAPLVKEKKALNLIVDVANNLRDSYKQGMLPRPLSTRALVRIVKHLEAYPEDDITIPFKKAYNLEYLDTNAQAVIEKVLEAFGLGKKEDVEVKRPIAIPLNIESFLSGDWGEEEGREKVKQLIAECRRGDFRQTDDGLNAAEGRLKNLQIEKQKKLNGKQAKLTEIEELRESYIEAEQDNFKVVMVVLRQAIDKIEIELQNIEADINRIDEQENRYRQDISVYLAIKEAAQGIYVIDKQDKQFLIIYDFEYERGQGGPFVPDIELERTDTNIIHLRDILKDIILNENILLVGETGTGKSSLILYLCKLLNRNCRVMSLNEDTDVKDLLVRQTFGEKEEGKTGWSDSVLVEAMRKGDYIILDEIDRVQPGVLSALNNILQFRQVTLPNGEVVFAHPDFRVFATMNPPKPPYTGNLLSGELEDRFSIYSIDFLPKDEEIAVLQNHAPSVEKTILEELVDAANNLRTSYRQGFLPRPLSTRTLVRVVEHLEVYPEDDVISILRKAYNLEYLNADAQASVEKALEVYKFERTKKAIVIQPVSITQPKIPLNLAPWQDFAPEEAAFRPNESDYSLQEENYRVKETSFAPQLTPSDTIIPEEKAATTEIEKTLQGHSGDVMAVAYSSDGRLVVSGSKDGTLKLWNLETGEVNTLITGSGEIWTVAISPDKRWIASAGTGGNLQLWDLENQVVKTLKGHTGGILSTIGFSQDSNLLVTGGRDKAVKVWNLRTGRVKVLTGHEREIEGTAISPNGDLVASGGWDNIIRVWNSRTNRVKILRGHSDTVGPLVFSEDGESLISGSIDNTVKIWNLSTNQVKTLRGHNSAVWSISISNEGRIASGDQQGVVKIWDIEQSRVKTLQAHSGTAASVSFAPDGEEIVSGGFDDVAKIWDINKEERLLAKQAEEDLLRRALEVAQEPVKEELNIEIKTKTVDNQEKEYLTIGNVEMIRGQGGLYVPQIDIEHIPTNLLYLKDLLKDANLGENTLLVGETGTGKSSLVLYLARLLNRECKVMSLNEDTDVKDLLVRQTFGEKEEGKTGWSDSVLVEAMRNGTYIILDEIDRVQPGVLSSLNNILQFRQVTLPNGEVVRAHPDFRVFATMNPPRPPYIGNLLSGELEDRFSIHTIDYLPEEEEITVLKTYAPKVKESRLKDLVRVANDLRNAYKNGLLPRPLSTRALVRIAKHLNSYPKDDIVNVVRKAYNLEYLNDNAQGLVDKVLEVYGLTGKRTLTVAPKIDFVSPVIMLNGGPFSFNMVSPPIESSNNNTLEIPQGLLQLLQGLTRIITNNPLLKMIPWQQMAPDDTQRTWRYLFGLDQIQYLPEDLAHEDEDIPSALTMHEVWHVIFSNAEVIDEELRNNRSFLTLLNPIEDPRINNMGVRKHRGAESWIRKLYDERYGIKDLEEEKIMRQSQPLHLQFGYGLIYRWFTGEDDPRITNQRVINALKQCEADIIAAYSTDSPKESYEIIRDKIWPVYQELIEEATNNAVGNQAMQKMAEKGQLGKEMVGKDGKPVPIEQIPEDMKKELQEKIQEELEKMTPEQLQELIDSAKAGIQEAEQEFNKEFEGKMIPDTTLSDEELSPQEKAYEEQFEEGIKELRRITTEKAEAEESLEERSAEVEAILEGERLSRGGVSRVEEAEYEEYLRPVKPFILVLRRHLSMVLQKTDRDRIQRSRSFGDLDPEALAEIPTGTDRIFARNLKAGKFNYRIVLLIDGSYSMKREPNRYKKAIEGTVLLMEALKDIPGIDFEIAVFNDRTPYLPFKKLGERVTKKKAIETVKGIEANVGVDTRFDAGCIAKAVERIKSLKRTDKDMLIVITDGNPDRPETQERQELEKLFSEAMGIKIFGIGIGPEAMQVEKVYPNGVWVEDLSRLSVELSVILRKELKAPEPTGPWRAYRYIDSIEPRSIVQPFTVKDGRLILSDAVTNSISAAIRIKPVIIDLDVATLIDTEKGYLQLRGWGFKEAVENLKEKLGKDINNLQIRLINLDNRLSNNDILQILGITEELNDIVIMPHIPVNHFRFRSLEPFLVEDSIKIAFGGNERFWGSDIDILVKKPQKDQVICSIGLLIAAVSILSEDNDIPWDIKNYLSIMSEKQNKDDKTVYFIFIPIDRKHFSTEYLNLLDRINKKNSTQV